MADDSPRLDLEMLDKLISKLDQVYVKALEVTDQLDKLASTKFSLGFSKEFKAAAEDLDTLLSVIKGFNRSNFKVTEGLYDFFQDIARISNIKVGRVNTKSYNSIAEVIEKITNLINTTKVSVSDAKRLTSVMEQFGLVMTTLSSITTGRGIPVRQILVVQSVIKPIINILKDMVDIAATGLTVGKADSLVDVFKSFKDIINSISLAFTNVSAIPKGSTLKALFSFSQSVLPVIRYLGLMIEATKDITVTKIQALADIFSQFRTLIDAISNVFTKGSNISVVQAIKLHNFMKAFAPTLNSVADIVIGVSKFEGKSLGNAATVFENIGLMLEGISKTIMSLKGFGGISAAIQNLTVVLPLFGSIQEILRILLRFSPSELNAVGRTFLGLGNIFSAISTILGSLATLKLGNLIASIGIIKFVNALFRQIKEFIVDTVDFPAARLDGVGQIFRGVGQIFIGLGDSLNAIKKNQEGEGFFKGLFKVVKDFTILLAFLRPLFRTVSKVLGSVVDVPANTVQAVGEIFSSLGGIARALAQFSRDAARITSFRELFIIIGSMRGVFGALGGVVGSILKATKGVDNVPLGPLKDLIETILEVIKLFSRIGGSDSKGFKQNELKLLEETFNVLPRVFNKFKIKGDTESSLRSFVELLSLVSDASRDFSGIQSLEKLITVLSSTDKIDIKASGLAELGRELKDFFDSFKGVEPSKIEVISTALRQVNKSNNLVNKSTETLTSSTGKLTDSFEDALISERVRTKIYQYLTTALQEAGSRALDFARNISAPGIIGNSISKLRELGDAIRDIGDELRDAGEEIRDFGTELLDNFGIGNLFQSEAVQGAIDFDRIGTQLQVFGNLSDDARKQAEEFAFELGRQYPISANEALNATLDLLKAGQSLEDIRLALPSIADLTALSDSGNLEEISGAVIQVVSQFDNFRDGVTGSFENTSTAADILSAAADGSISSVESLAEGLVKVGPIANSFGFNLEETAAALALFSNAGLDGAEAGTQLKSLLNNLQTSTAQKTLRDLNIDVTDAAGNFLDLNSIINNINSSLNKTSTITFVPQSPLGPEAQTRYDAATKAAANASRQLALYRDGLTGGALDQEKANKKIAEYEQILANANGVIAEVTGSQEEADAITREITRTQEENAKAVKDLAGSYGSVGLNILLAAGDDGLQYFIDQMNDVLPASERARLLLDNLAGDMIQLQGSIQTALTVAFLPLINEFFRPAVKILRAVVDGFLNMDRSVLEFIGTATGLISLGATLAGVFLIIFGSLVQVGGMVLIVVGSLLNFTTVIGIVIGGLTALTAGFVAIASILGVFVPLIVGATAVFKALFKIFSEDIGGASSDAVGFFQELGGAISDLIKPFGAFFGAVKAAFSGGNQPLFLLEGVGRTIANIFREMGNVLSSGFIARLRDGAGQLTSFFNLVATTFQSGGLKSVQDQLDLIRNALFDFVNVFADEGFGVAFEGLTSQLDLSLASIALSLNNFYRNVFGSNLISESLQETFASEGFSAGISAAIQGFIDSLIKAAISNRDSIRSVFITLMKTFFSPIKVVGFFANLFGIKPLQDFVNEFNKLFETVVGGAFDFIFNLLEGQSFNDAFINAFGDGAKPLLDLITELGTAAENIFEIVSKIFEDFFGRFVDEGEDVGIVNVLFGIIERVTQGLALLNDLILDPLSEGDVAGAFANVGTLIAEGFFGIVSSFTSLFKGVDVLGIFAGVATSIVNLLAVAIKNALVTIGDVLGIDVNAIIQSIEDTLNANAEVLNSEEGGPLSFFAVFANTVVGLLVSAVQTAFAGLGALLNIDTTAIQEALGGKLGEILDTIKTIFFGGEDGESSIFDDITTIANNLATAIQAILDAFTGGEGGDPEKSTDALQNIVNFFGDLAVLTLDGVNSALVIIKELLSFLADQDPKQLTQLGISVGALGAGFLVWKGVTGLGGVSAILPALTSAITTLGTTPLTAISAGISSLGTAFTTFASSILGKIAGLISIILIVKNIADNIDKLKESLQAFADGNYGEGITTFFDALGDIFTGIGLDAYELLGLDNLLGRSRTEIEATISQVEGLFSTFGVLFSLFVETQIIGPLRRFIDVDVADVINEVRKLVELAQLALSGGDTGKLLGDESFLQTLFAQEDLNIDALAGFISNDQTSEFLKEEIRILGRKAGPELAAQLAATLNGASTEDLIKWGEIINATGIFPDIAAAILNSGGDLTPVISAIFQAGGEVTPEDVQTLSGIIQQHLLNNLTFENFNTDLGILEAIRDSIIASGGDSTAIDEAIAYIKGQFEALAGQEGDEPVEVKTDVTLVPEDVTIKTDDLTPSEPVKTDGEIITEVPMTFLPEPVKFEPQEYTPDTEGVPEETVVEGGTVTLVPDNVVMDTSEAETEIPEDTAFDTFGAETLADPAELELLNLQLAETNTQLTNIELAFGLLQTSAPLAVEALTTVQSTFELANSAASTFYGTIISQSLIALATNAAAYSVINGNITRFGTESSVAQGKYNAFVSSSGGQTMVLSQIIQRETMRMTSGFNSLNKAVKELTANLRDAIDLAKKAAQGVSNINGVDAGGPGSDGGRAIGGTTLRGGLYGITERGSEILEENGKRYLIAGDAGRVLTLAQAFPEISSSRSGVGDSTAMTPNSGVVNITSSTTISEGDIIINVTEPGASAADIAAEVRTVLETRDARGGAEDISVKEKLRTNHR